MWSMRPSLFPSLTRFISPSVFTTNVSYRIPSRSINFLPKSNFQSIPKNILPIYIFHTKRFLCSKNDEPEKKETDETENSKKSSWAKQREKKIKNRERNAEKKLDEQERVKTPQEKRKEQREKELQKLRDRLEEANLNTEEEIEKQSEIFDEQIDQLMENSGAPSILGFIMKGLKYIGLFGSIFLIFYLLGPPRETLSFRDFLLNYLKPKIVSSVQIMEKGAIITDTEGKKHFMYIPNGEIFQKRLEYMEFVYQYSQYDVFPVIVDNTPEIEREKRYRFFQHYLFLIIAIYMYSRSSYRTFGSHRPPPLERFNKNPKNINPNYKYAWETKEDREKREKMELEIYEKRENLKHKELEILEKQREILEQEKEKIYKEKPPENKVDRNQAVDDQNRAIKSDIKFKDVAGLDEAKMEVMEFVDFLKNPEKYKSLGAKTPKGALLVGPPGCGKTLLAKAIAGEAQVPFFSTSASSFVEVFVGVGAQKVRQLFQQAKKVQPSIVFIDEIDAIGSKRQKVGNSANEEREGTLNQLLVELDGFDSGSEVIVLAGTNRSNILDDALTRPGRFDRQIEIGKPHFKARKEIFQIYLKKLVLQNSDLIPTLSERLSLFTPGFSGAEISQVCNEAALLAARKDKNFIEDEDFDEAIDKTIAGLERKSHVLSPQIKKVVAYHEAGHAIVGWYSKSSEPMMKASIVPRGLSALGFTSYIPKDSYISTHEQLFETMCVMLGGRVAEEITFGEITTGASDDLSRLTSLAYQKIVRFGMSKKVGPIGLAESSSGEFISRRIYSESTAEIIDEEVHQLIRSAYENTKHILLTHQDSLIKVAEALLSKEVLSYEEVAKLIGERPQGKTLQQTLDEEIERHKRFEREMQELAEKEKNSQEKDQQQSEVDSEANNKKDLNSDDLIPPPL